MAGRVVVYGEYGDARCERALRLLAGAGLDCETVDVRRCAHCRRELAARLPAGREGAALPQAFAPDGDHIGNEEDLRAWLRAGARGS